MPRMERNKILPHMSTLGFWGRRGIEILARAWKAPNQSFPVFLPAGLAGPSCATVLSVLSAFSDQRGAGGGAHAHRQWGRGRHNGPGPVHRNKR